jgi:Pyruvate/2-oxoacid:ferredoxin oxidoreductase delta subunit
MLQKRAAVAKPKFRVDHLVASVFVAAVAFYIYSSQQLLLGVILAPISGIFTFLASTSNKTYRMRSVFVVALTIVMWVTFAAFLAQLGGYLELWISRHERISLVPSALTGSGYVSILCPFLIPSSVGNQIYVSTPIYIKFFTEFPLSLGTFLLVFAFFMVFALLLGKGWCGWLCPFGGLGEAARQAKGFGRVYNAVKRRFMRLTTIRASDITPAKASQLIFDLKYAILFVTILLSLIFAVQWFCVFCWAGVLSWVSSPLNLSITILIAVIFFIGLPLISRRKWCHFICPLGAALSLLDKVAPFKIVVNRESCTDCGVCSTLCPTFATQHGVDGGSIKVTDTCDKCLVCVEKCPQSAIALKIFSLQIEPKVHLVTLSVVAGLILFYWFIVVVYELALILV